MNIIMSCDITNRLAIEYIKLTKAHSRQVQSDITNAIDRSKPKCRNGITKKTKARSKD